MAVTMREFLLSAREGFRDRGTLYMVPMIDEMLQMDVNTEEDLQEFVVVCKEERDRHVPYNLKFMYYWSVLTYMTDLVSQFRLKNEVQKESSK